MKFLAFLDKVAGHLAGRIRSDLNRPAQRGRQDFDPAGSSRSVPGYEQGLVLLDSGGVRWLGDANQFCQNWLDCDHSRLGRMNSKMGREPRPNHFPHQPGLADLNATTQFHHVLAGPGARFVFTTKDRRCSPAARHEALKLYRVKEGHHDSDGETGSPSQFR